MSKITEYIDKELEQMNRSIIATPNEDYLLQFTEANKGTNDYLLMQMAKNYGYKIALLNVQDEIENLKTTIMIALNKKHQARVNKAVYWLTKYNTANDMRNEADGDGNEKMYTKYDNLCQKTFDKYEEYTSELPVREVKQIEKSELY
jgi:hypothetical protein